MRGESSLGALNRSYPVSCHPRAGRVLELVFGLRTDSRVDEVNLQLLRSVGEVGGLGPFGRRDFSLFC